MTRDHVNEMLTTIGTHTLDVHTLGAPIDLPHVDLAPGSPPDITPVKPIPYAPTWRTAPDLDGVTVGWVAPPSRTSDMVAHLVMARLQSLTPARTNEDPASGLLRDAVDPDGIHTAIFVPTTDPTVIRSIVHELAELARLGPEPSDLVGALESMPTPADTAFHLDRLDHAARMRLLGNGDEPDPPSGDEVDIDELLDALRRAWSTLLVAGPCENPRPDWLRSWHSVTSIKSDGRPDPTRFRALQPFRPRNPSRRGIDPRLVLMSDRHVVVQDHFRGVAAGTLDDVDGVVGWLGGPRGIMLANGTIAWTDPGAFPRSRRLVTELEERFPDSIELGPPPPEWQRPRLPWLAPCLFRLAPAIAVLVLVVLAVVFGDWSAFDVGPVVSGIGALIWFFAGLRVASEVRAGPATEEFHGWRP